MNKFLISFVVANLSATGLCFAASPQFANQKPALLVGPYIGIQLGLGGMDMPDLPRYAKHEITDLGGDYKVDNDLGFAGRLFGGYLWASNKLQYGLELGGMIYPNNTYKLDINMPINANADPLVSIKMKYKGHFIDLLGVVKYYFSSNWNIFAKLGAAYTYQKLTINAVEDAPLPVPPESFTKKWTKNRVLPEAAAGIGYHITPNAEASLTYNRVLGSKLTINCDSARVKVASVDGITAGLTWLFG